MSVVVSSVARMESSDTLDIGRKETVVKLAELYRSAEFSCAYWYWRKFLEGPRIGDSKAAKALFSELISGDLGPDWAAATEQFTAVKEEYHWAVMDPGLECIRKAVGEGPMEPGSPEARRIFAEYADHYSEITENAAQAEKTARAISELSRSHLFIRICADSAEDLAWRAHAMLTFTVDLVEAEMDRAESKFWALPMYSRGLPRRAAAARAAARTSIRTTTTTTTTTGGAICPRARVHGCRRAVDHDPCCICAARPRTFGHVRTDSADSADSTNSGSTGDDDDDDDEPQPVPAHIRPRGRAGARVVVTDCCGAHICTACAWQWIFERRNLRCPNCASPF